MIPHFSSTELADKLREQVEQAIREYRQARARVQSVGELSTDIPRPDGTLMRSQALKEETRCRQEVRKKLQQFNDYLLHGIVPEGFGKKEPGRESSRAEEKRKA